MFWFLLLLTPYIIIYLLIYFGLASFAKADTQSDLTDIPNVGVSSNNGEVLSVIIPVRNETKNISNIIECLAAQRYPKNLNEIIIVDDNSTDNTFTEAVRLTKSLNNFKVYQNKSTGKKNAIHFGISRSKGDLIITTDADCIFEPNWLASISQRWSSTMADLIIGHVRMSCRNRFLAPFIEIEHSSIQALTIASVALGRPVMASGANIAFTRELAEGYLDYIKPEIDSGDDMFLLHHAKRKGKTIVFNSSIEGGIKTMFEGSLMDFLRQRSRWSAKSIYYKDSDTIILGAITAITNIVIVVALVLTVIYPPIIKLTLLLYIIKSVPDILILMRMDRNSSRKYLKFWFIPLQLIYPIYVTITLIFGILSKTKWNK